MAPMCLFWALEYRPEPLSDTPVRGEAPERPPPERLALLSWNIGYAGLGADADFFMDGGLQVRAASAERVRENLDAILTLLRAADADLILLQEVDSDASRTYGIDEVAAVTGALPGFFSSRAVNFKVFWIPVPLLRPLGGVESGLLSLSRARPAAARRHQLPGLPAWPRRMFDLKRCLHEIRLAAPDGRDWVILHLHLSAFDKGGVQRREQMAALRELVLKLAAEGHHVVAGGDWNQAFPGLDARSFPTTDGVPEWFQRVPEGWTPPGWRWAFDREIPSLRATNKPYVPGENFLTSVDGFLVGPGVRIESVRATDLGFAHSDHHPVRLEVALGE